MVHALGRAGSPRWEWVPSKHRAKQFEHSMSCCWDHLCERAPGTREEISTRLLLLLPPHELQAIVPSVEASLGVRWRSQHGPRDLMQLVNLRSPRERRPQGASLSQGASDCPNIHAGAVAIEGGARAR